jgi:hypothetical protein
MRFGTLFADLGALQSWLAPRVSILKPALALAAGHSEWMLAVHEDPSLVPSWLSTKTQAERRVGLARAEAAVVKWAEASRLALLADVGRGGLPAWTVLVPHDQAAMMTRGGHLPGGLPAGLSLRLSGPWPAYGLAAAALAMEPAHVRSAV